MTRDEILALDAGRELDALIASRIFGETVETGWAYGFDKYVDRTLSDDGTGDDLLDVLGLEAVVITSKGARLLPNYSVNIAAAWQVVERLREMGICVKLNNWIGKDGWEVQTFSHSNVYEFLESAGADTAPLAICRAALLAVAVSEQVEVVR